MNRNLRKILAAGMAGNALEFYDFSIYAFFSLQLGQVFFPSTDPMTSILSSLAVFAVGFIMRPVGGLLFGHIGDKYGRKRALMLCVTIMALPTFAIGLLPGYAEIGIWAPVALVVCRLVQGLSTGGEYNGAAIFVVEHAGIGKKGYAGSLINSSSYMGWVLAALISFPFVTFIQVSWAWRVPFLFGLVVGIVGFYLRRQISETPEFEAYSRTEKPKPVPFLAVLREKPGAVLSTIGIAAFSGVIAYTTLSYLNTYLLSIQGWSKPSALLITMLGSVIYVVMSPVYGRLSDRMDPRTICLWAITGILVLIYPVFYMWTSGSLLLVILGQILWASITVIYHAPMNLLMAKLFPVSLRFSGIGIGYSLGMAIFGGTSPLMSTWLVDRTQNPMAPMLWITLVGLIGFFSIYYTQRSSKKKISLETTYYPAVQKKAS